MHAARNHPIALLISVSVIAALALGAAAFTLSRLRAGTPDATLTADFELDGRGQNIDSLAFWETEPAGDVLLLATAKGNQLVEVWRFPFVGQEQPPLTHPSFGPAGTRVNGIAVDQAGDRLYVSVSEGQSTVSVFSLPDLRHVGEFVRGAVDLQSEPNIALLPDSSGQLRVYVSADDILYMYDTASGAEIGRFRPDKGLETVLADARQQVLYIPDENDRTGVYAYHPDGTPYLKNGTHQFGATAFQSDAEGIALYHCPAGGSDDGSGFLVVADQVGELTEFEFFDRQSWAHLGTLAIHGVSNTDGIASTQMALPGYPLGLFTAVNDDATIVGVGWDTVLDALNLSCTTATPQP